MDQPFNSEDLIVYSPFSPLAATHFTGNKLQEFVFDLQNNFYGWDIVVILITAVLDNV